MKTQQRQRKTPGLHSQWDLEGQQTEVSVVRRRVFRTDPHAVAIALGEAPVRLQVLSRCLVRLYLLSITPKPFALGRIRAVFRGRGWLGKVRELPPGTARQRQSWGVSQAAGYSSLPSARCALTSCPTRDPCRPVAPPQQSRPRVRAQSPGPEAGP